MGHISLPLGPFTTVLNAKLHMQAGPSVPLFLYGYFSTINGKKTEGFCQISKLCEVGSK